MSCCRLCCKECKWWWKAFTKTEVILACIEAVLLVILIGFLTFLVVHLMTCSSVRKTRPHPSQSPKPVYKHHHTDGDEITFLENGVTVPHHTLVHALTSKENQGPQVWKEVSTTRCTATEPNVNSTETISVFSKDKVGDSLEEYNDPNEGAKGIPDVLDAEDSDGELADDDEKNLIIALVKIKPSGLTFGCILTILSNHWTVTAASCIDSIEEVDSLDSFVMMDNYGEEKKGQSHVVSDVRVHPQYVGGNSSYDLAMLKTEDPLGKRAAELPTWVDYFRITIGEKMVILGFGNFRSIDHGPLGQRVRAAGVHALPHAQCTSSRDSGPRHLVPKSRVLHARCAASPLCAGVRFARGSPCNYCAGAPLLSRYRLLGIMADNGACGAACEPALYANVAALRPWLAHVIA